mmetsp:Transcript_52503/g.77795  ORF Transcript_52503/g.77795 Transcript_52503/m.77795 type:complete len:94 (+) Transcript_52503:385-666(+)
MLTFHRPTTRSPTCPPYVMGETGITKISLLNHSTTPDTNEMRRCLEMSTTGMFMISKVAFGKNYCAVDPLSHIMLTSVDSSVSVRRGIRCDLS